MSSWISYTDPDGNWYVTKVDETLSATIWPFQTNIDGQKPDDDDVVNDIKTTVHRASELMTSSRFSRLQCSVYDLPVFHLASRCTNAFQIFSLDLYWPVLLEINKIKSRWGEFSAPVQTGPRAHPASCTMGTGSFPGVESGRGVTLSSHPLLVPWSRKSRSIPLLPLWAVRSVQSLSACIRVHFTFTFFSNFE